MPTLQASLRLSFSNILFPTHFSDASSAALPYAQAFARIYGARIFVAHAVTPHPPIFLPMEPIPLELDGEWYDAQARLNHFLDCDALRGTVHEGVAQRGELWNVLDDVIRRHDVELIILGSHGKHGLKKLVLGSDAEQIFRNPVARFSRLGQRWCRPPNRLRSARSCSPLTSPWDPYTRFPMLFRWPKKTRHT
jgi:nucleotide-binding universal stress UspA family protein